MTDPSLHQTAAIYCRLSEEDRNKSSETSDSESIQNQKSMLVSFAHEQGWAIYDIYSDDDYTGSDRKRPEFNRLLKDAENRKFDIILCKTQSRFTRELELVEKYIHGLFPLWGIRFISIVDHADTSNKGNKKSRQINGLVNEWYLEDMSDNIRSVLTDKRKKGQHIGAFALYGYQKDPDRKGHLLIDEEAASVVREVFTLFSQGYGKTAIARLLNERHIPNPTEYKRLHGLHYWQPRTPNSTLWKYSAIAHMLQNEMYIGNMVQGKYGSISYKTKQNRPRPQSEWYRVKNTHEPIIDQNLWNQVQSLLRKRTKPFSNGKTGLFAGKVRCAYCGYIMRSSQSHNRYYLQCPNHHIAKESCTGAFISVEILKQTVITEFNQFAREYLDKNELAAQLSSIKQLYTPDISRQKKQLETNISMYLNKISEYQTALQNLYLDKVRGIITESEFLSFSHDFSDDKNRLEILLSDTRNALSGLQINEKTEEPAKNSSLHKLEPYTQFKDLNRELIETTIDYIEVERRISGTEKIPITIHWNF
ncbi:recombinase family protein [Blautia sp. HCP3S3_G3]|uniref:recombinase family protein n=1 Tax=Blautia sp. HCP3S3_G3 TaxID=3438913 RepID=UPI003F8CE0B7